MQRGSATPPRPTVWVVTPSLHREGGTERAVAEQVERWRDRFALSLYTMETWGVNLSGVRVRRLWWPPGPHIVRYIWWFLANHAVRWWDGLRLGRPDAVHSPGVNCFDARAIGVHMVFAKHWERVRTAVPASSSPARTLHRLAYWGLVRWLERIVYRGPATLWALSREDAAALEGLSGRPAGSVPVVPYGVDTRAFAPAPRHERRDEARRKLGVESRVVLLLIGNDWYKKGLDHAIRALALLPEHYLLAAAGRDDPTPFERLARELGVESRLSFWPHTADVIEYYAAADCLIAPSREDAFHLPALEAMACGLPVVLAAATGASEVAGDDGETAVIVRDPARSDELAQAVLRATDGTADAERRAKAGRALAERRSWDDYAERTGDLVAAEARALRVIVLAADPWGTGGIERATRALLGALGDRYGADRVGLVAVWGPEPERTIPACRRLHAGRGRPGSGPAGRVGLLRRLRFTLAAISAARRWSGQRLALVACHAHVAPVAWACRLITGAPYAVWGHGTEAWATPRTSVALAMRGAQAIFAGSRFTAEALAHQLRRPPEAIQLLPYPLSPEASGGAPSVGGAGTGVLTVARLNREDAYKGVDTLLLAWPQVLARQPDAELLVVGDGDDRPRLTRLAARLGLGDRVRFAGRLNDADLVKAYRGARLFALPGRARLAPKPEGEGFGLAFIEAASAGLPCVAGRAGGAVEAVEDGVTGCLVDPGSPRAVAEGVVRLLADPGLARRLGEAGRDRVAKLFTYSLFGERVGALAESLIE